MHNQFSYIVLVNLRVTSSSSFSLSNISLYIADIVLMIFTRLQIVWDKYLNGYTEGYQGVLIW